MGISPARNTIYILLYAMHMHVRCNVHDSTVFEVVESSYIGENMSGYIGENMSSYIGENMSS